MDSTSRMKPRTMASSPEISITTMSTMSSSVIGMVQLAWPRLVFRGLYSRAPARRHPSYRALNRFRR